ncbi:MAG: hypothetical protein KME54_17470, partial [Tolypothrix brevis GSE-NOS-MK-07-07A]|nr:hypothetical protein [Tolypothrix brevis GSE-NOS-MK-07-07A]
CFYYGDGFKLNHIISYPPNHTYCRDVPPERLYDDCRDVPTNHTYSRDVPPERLYDDCRDVAMLRLFHSYI